MLIVLLTIVLLSIIVALVILNKTNQLSSSTTETPKSLTPAQMAGLSQTIVKPTTTSKLSENFSNINIKSFFPFIRELFSDSNTESFQSSTLNAPTLNPSTLKPSNCTSNEKLDGNGCRLSLCNINGKSEPSILINGTLSVPKYQFMFVHEVIYYIECVIKNYFQFIDYEALNTTVKNIMNVNINELPIFEKSCVFTVIFFSSLYLYKYIPINIIKFFNMFYYILMTSAIIPNTYTTSGIIRNVNTRCII